jgi:hypothetical protein
MNAIQDKMKKVGLLIGRASVWRRMVITKQSFLTMKAIARKPILRHLANETS